MWHDIINWTFDIVAHIGDFASWLFTPIAYNSVFGAILKRVWNLEVTFRPIDLLGVGTLTTLLILLLIHLANVITG